MTDIPLYSTFKKIRPIEKGLSCDIKYYIETDEGKHLLLRIADISEYEKKKLEYELMKKLDLLHIPMPKVIDFGVCNGNTSVYVLLEWIDGQEVEEALPMMNEEEQYLLGKKAGKILKVVHSLDTEEEATDWYTRYFSVIDERMEAFHREGVLFLGSEHIISFLNTNKYLLKERPQCYHHGDYHIGNMIKTANDNLFIIDWQTVDFDNYGDPWYEFNRIRMDYPAFASGQIDGYFDCNPPESFWKLLAYYLSAGAITSIVWAKYFSPDSLDSILQLNRDILSWFDGMKHTIPNWYRGVHNENSGNSFLGKVNKDED